MSFFAHARTMLTGTFVAQAIPLLALPLLTRLHPPEAFGLLAVLTSASTALAVLGTCRLDLAIMLPKIDAEAMQLAGYAVRQTLVVCLLVGMLLLPLAGLVASSLDQPEPVFWIWFLPPMIWCIATAQILGALAARQQAFTIISASSVLSQAAYTTSAVACGLSSGVMVAGLSSARLLGQALTVILMVTKGPVTGSDLLVSVRDTALPGLLRRYRQFFVFNTPYSLIGTLTRDSPVYLLSTFSSITMAGFYGLARSITLAPSLLFSSALSQVFFREATTSPGSAKLQQLTQRLLRLGLYGTAAIFACLFIWGETLFAAAFGEEWAQAGVMAAWLSVPAWLSLQTGWPERLFEVHGRQGVSFSIQLGADILTALSVSLVLLYTADPVMAVATYSLCNVIYHQVFLYFLFKVAGFNTHWLLGTLAKGWAIFCASSLGMGVIAANMAENVAVVLAILLFATMLGAGFCWREYRSNLEAETLES